MSWGTLRESLDPVVAWCRSLWIEASTIWFAGGGAMIAIATIALVMFSVGMSVHLKLRRKGFLHVPEKTWRRWIDKPAERKGPIGDLITRARACRSLDAVAHFFEKLNADELTPFERDLKVMKVCVSAAPLVGLLGTVIGMLATFGALATGSGGDKTMGLVAEGISEALITTETGLVIAIPGLFFQYQLGRKYERYKAFLAHLQTVCTQTLYREVEVENQDAVRHAAAERVAQILYARLRTEERAATDEAPAALPAAERISLTTP